MNAPGTAGNGTSARRWTPIVAATAIWSVAPGCNGGIPVVEAGDEIACTMKITLEGAGFPDPHTVSQDNFGKKLITCVGPGQDAKQACEATFCTPDAIANLLPPPPTSVKSCVTKSADIVQEHGCADAVPRAAPGVAQYRAEMLSRDADGTATVKIKTEAGTLSPVSNVVVGFNIDACTPTTCQLTFEVLDIETLQPGSVKNGTVHAGARASLVRPVTTTLDRGTGLFSFSAPDSVWLDTNWVQTVDGDTNHGSVTVSNGSQALFGKIDLAQQTMQLSGGFEDQGVNLAINNLSGPIVNQPPVAGMDVPATVACAAGFGGQGDVTLDATPSTDPDDNIDRYVWWVDGAPFLETASAVQLASLPLGLHTVALTVVDLFNSFDGVEQQVEVVDEDPPVVLVEDGESPACVPDFGTVRFPVPQVFDACVDPEDLFTVAFVTKINGFEVSGAPSVVTISGSQALAELPPGNHEVTWFVGDSSGNVTQAVQKVHVPLLDPQPGDALPAFLATCCQSRTQSRILGTDDPDALAAPSDEGVCMVGFAGDDLLLGAGGEDWIYGGRGGDDVVAGAGVDLVYTQGGDDVVVATSDLDVLPPGGGGSSLPGNRVYGGFGDDVLTTSGRADEIHGGRGADVISAGAGPDFIYPGRDVDVVFAGPGDDTVVIYDRCELPNTPGLLPFEVIWCGPGEDTLRAPAPPWVVEDGTFKLLYVPIGCENLVITEALRYRSECHWQGIGGGGGVVNP